MSLGKRLFIGGEAAAAAVTSETVDVFGDSSGIALYTLDYDASDESGNYDGTPSNVTFGVDGQINWGASFNGSSSDINIGGSQFNSLTEITLSAWLYSNDNTNYSYALMVGDAGTDGDALSISRWNNATFGNFSPKEVYVNIGSSSYESNFILEPNNWAHVVVTYSGTSLKIYVNDSLSASHTVASMSFNSSGNGGYIGRYIDNSSYNWNGLIDQVRIFNKAISSDQVSTLNGETATVYTATTDTVNYQGTNVAYYKFDNNALDETSNNHDGTESNITYSFGRYGNAAVFNGTSSRITTGSFNLSNTGNSSFSCWFRTTLDSTTPQCLVEPDPSTSNGLVIPLVVNGVLRLAYYSLDLPNNTVDGTTNVADGNWHHLVMTFDNSAGSVKFYLDGETSTPEVSHTFTSTGDPHNMFTGSSAIGAFSTNYFFFNGQIDQVRIFSSALDTTAVENLYNEKQAYITKDGSNPFGDGNEEAFYKMETASGTNVADSTGTNSGVASNITFTSGSGLFGTYAADFNGSNSKITLDSTNIADVVTFDGAGSTDECTLSFWVQPQGTSTTNYYCIFSVGYGLELYYLNGNFTSFSNDTASGTSRNINGFQTSGTYSINEWHHVVFTFTPTAQNWYVNGVIDGSNTTTSYTPYAEPDATIGCFRNTSPAYDNLATFDGLIDHVRIFDRVLDGDEVFKLYAEVIN